MLAILLESNLKSVAITLEVITPLHKPMPGIDDLIPNNTLYAEDGLLLSS